MILGTSFSSVFQMFDELLVVSFDFPLGLLHKNVKSVVQ